MKQDIMSFVRSMLLDDFDSRARLRRLASRSGQYTSLVAFDPLNRGSEFVAKLLEEAGLVVEIEDEGEPVLAPSPAGRSSGESDETEDGPISPSIPE